MYELMCWSWSSKPQHRPSFVIIRQLALSQPFTRLHYAMRVEPRKHLVSAIAVRYYTTAPPTNDVTQSYPHVTQSYPQRNVNSSSDVRKLSLHDIHKRKLSQQISGSELLYNVATTCSSIPTASIYAANDDNAEVYYGTDYGIVGVADIQQLATSSQVILLAHTCYYTAMPYLERRPQLDEKSSGLNKHFNSLPF